jgi:hypothetical protein
MEPSIKYNVINDPAIRNTFDEKGLASGERIGLF